MRTWIIASALASAALAPLSAQEAPPPLTVAQFMERWNEVAKLKEMARVSPDMRLLADEIVSGFKAYKSQIDADAQAGKPPRACPIKGTKATVTSTEILAELDAIPPQRRGMPFREALFAMLDKRYPCG